MRLSLQTLTKIKICVNFQQTFEIFLKMLEIKGLIYISPTSTRIKLKLRTNGHLVIAELGYPGLLTSILHLGMNPLHTVIRTG